MNDLIRKILQQDDMRRIRRYFQKKYTSLSTDEVYQCACLGLWKILSKDETQEGKELFRRVFSQIRNEIASLNRQRKQPQVCHETPYFNRKDSLIDLEIDIDSLKSPDKHICYDYIFGNNTIAELASKYSLTIHGVKQILQQSSRRLA